MIVIWGPATKNSSLFDCLSYSKLFLFILLNGMVRALNGNKSKILVWNCNVVFFLQIYFSFFPFHQNYLTAQLIGFMMEFHRQVNKEKNIYEFLQESFVEFEPRKAIYSYLFKFPRSEQAEIQLNSCFYWIIFKIRF